jgi:hypothetical protein
MTAQINGYTGDHQHPAVLTQLAQLLVRLPQQRVQRQRLREVGGRLLRPVQQARDAAQLIKPRSPVRNLRVVRKLLHTCTPGRLATPLYHAPPWVVLKLLHIALVNQLSTPERGLAPA